MVLETTSEYSDMHGIGWRGVAMHYKPLTEEF